MRLSGRRALVTGGSRGIGRAIAIGLAKEGADVVVSYRADRESAEATAAAIREFGRKAVIVQGDAAVRADVNRFVAEAAAALGGIDLLVNNAGVLKRTPFLEIEEREWDATVDTNLKGAFLVGQAVARHMVERGIAGAIVNLSSSAAIRPSPNLAHYSVSKAGVSMLTQAMAVELAPHGIRVNAVCPGLIETDINRKDIADPAFREGRLARIPLRLIGAPEDVVGAVVYLASADEARLVTGALLVIDGGFTIY
ncbi:MAG TPA: 3-oxoacyl-ACP reductase family protein [Thermodesulfobacteriota bacterium]